MTTHICLRVSTTKQDENRSSLADQERRCRGAAMIHGGEEPLVWSDIISGGVPLSQRPAGGVMFASLVTGDTVIAAKLDRLFRSASDALVTAELFQKRGIFLILLDCGAEPVTTGASKLFFNILAAVAEFENSRRAERMADGRAGKKARGGHVGGYVPYGFTKIGEGRDAALVANPREIETQQLAAALRADGMSLQAIGTQLVIEGHLSRSGGAWHPMQVKRMLEEGKA